MNTEPKIKEDYFVEEARNAKSFEATLEDIVTGFRSGKLEDWRTVRITIDGEYKWSTVGELCKNERVKQPSPQTQILMSFCVNCGSEYDAQLANNFCAHCGFGLRKNTPQSQNALENTSTINPPPASQTVKKPVVGIIVALVVGLVGLVWTCAVLFHTLYGSLSSTQIALQQSFPSLPIATYIGLAFALNGNVVLIIGALMAHLNHPSGAKVVRITSYSMIGLTFILVIITFFAVMGAEAWTTLDAPRKGALIGGLAGGTIGALLQWGFLLFLFRNQKKPKTNSPIISKRPLTPIKSILCPECGNKNEVSLGQTACFRCGAELMSGTVFSSTGWNTVS